MTMIYESVCKVCEGVFKRTLNPKAIASGKGKYCSLKCYYSSLMGKPSWNKGKPHTEEHKRHLKENHKGNTGGKWSADQRLRFSLKSRGENSRNWKGGVTEKNKLLRRSFEFKQWRESVFIRDDFTCVFCGVRGGEIHPDHIKPFADYPELRFELSNGRTLCAPCHRKTDTWGARRKV